MMMFIYLKTTQNAVEWQKRLKKRREHHRHHHHRHHELVCLVKIYKKADIGKNYSFILP